jgi:uncharacterized membrane protein YhaH (DUF805 family)
MQALRFLFSPSGRLRPRPFVLAVIVVYLAGLAAQRLTASPMLPYGLWPFAIVQALLIWIWFALHAKRLRDAGLGSGLAAGASLLYALSVVLMLLVGASFAHEFTAPSWGVAPTSTLGLIYLILLIDMISIVSILSGSPHYDVTWLILAGMTITAFLPPIFAITLTIRAAKRPSALERKA